MGENGILNKIKYAITRNQSTKGLMDDFRNIGINAGDELETVILAEDFWRKINGNHNASLLDYTEPSEIDELPYTKAEIGNTACYIHGILHDSSQKKKILSGQSRNFIFNQISKYSMPDKGIDYLCEYGFSGLFGLKKENEITLRPYYVRRIIGEKFRISQPSVNKIESCFWSDIIWNKDEDIINKTLKDIKYLPVLRKSAEEARLPVPLWINALDIKMKKQDKCHKCSTRIPCDPRTSLSMAEYIQKYAKKRNLSELHVLVGIKHEAEIAYYLNSKKQK